MIKERTNTVEMYKQLLKESLPVCWALKMPQVEACFQFCVHLKREVCQLERLFDKMNKGGKSNGQSWKKRELTNVGRGRHIDNTY